uniref:Cytochrome p450 n=1 Tax=Epiphyas postvittana TaxID=65032 RepID=A0A0K8TUH6_EPIPO
MIFLLCVVVPVLWVILFRYRRRRMYALASKISDGDVELPLIGLAHKFTGTTEDIMSSLKELSYAAMKEDGMIRGWLGHILYFLAVDPVDLEMVLKTCLEKDDLHRFLRKVIGYGGIFAPVQIWRPRRKILLPAFSPKIVDSFVPVFAAQSVKLAEKLGEKAGEKKFSIWPYLSSYTLDSVCETALGVKINAQEDDKSPFLVELNRLLQLVCERIFHLWLQPDWLYKLFPQHKKHESSLKILHDFTNDIIEKKRKEIQQLKSERAEADHQYDLSNYSTKTFLDLLIQFSGGEKGYSNLELREEILTLTIAATDTSATAVGYTFKMLAKYPDIQEKVLQELDEVFGDSDRLFVKEDLMKLKYLERVIKETLRLFPPVPFIIRKVEEEILLPSGRVLPAGSGVVVSIWGIHRDPKYWGPDAEQFDPDRFLPERFNLQHSCSFMPFSSGPRNCVGYQYALMSIKTALSTVLRTCRVVPDKDPSATPQIRVKLDIMMKAVDGYEIALERRRELRCYAT